MYEERLLERICNLEARAGERAGTDITRATRSIIMHLQRMLNTRQGGVPIDDDYGVPDLTNYPGDNLVETGKNIAATIRDFITRYEPRLDKVRISFQTQDEDVLALRFRLEGDLLRENKTPIVLETLVDSTGKISVAQ
ncbi:MAG: type VI secretion system baseplate subunit TssE [Pseudomonadota bacterium]